MKVGSKAFTESVILGEMATQLAVEVGLKATHVRELGGTRLLWDSLTSGAVDVYPEYTGTIRQELFAGESLPTLEAIRRQLAESNVLMSQPLGFNNTYAIGMKQDVAQRLGIKTISDLKRHPDLRFGFSNEFLDRGDGWPSLKSAYGLQPASVTGMVHSFAYRALDNGSIDATDIYSTDANINQYGLYVLEDDLGHFPNYEAVFLYRQDLEDRAAEWLDALRQLAGAIDDQQMIRMNEAVEINRRSESKTSAEFLNETFGLSIQAQETTLWTRLRKTTAEHLVLVLVSLSAAILVSVPLGIIAAKRPIVGQLIVGTAEIIQTIPGLALLVFMGVGFLWLGLPSIGPFPVICALFLYSLLPIIRNTQTGIASIPTSLTESAEALGLSPWQRLWYTELPMASRLILAGIKTTAVINVGYAALGGLIGAGGYGQPIMTGLRLNDEWLMLEGALPAALLRSRSNGSSNYRNASSFRAG